MRYLPNLYKHCVFFQKSGLVCLCFYAFMMHAIAKVKPNSLFTDHMVLQEGVPIAVWGTADEGEQITVSFNGQKLSARTLDGKWTVKLKPLPYVLTPKEMTISGHDTIYIRDILVGEVWLCSGQSNMERQLGPRPPQPLIANWEQERDAANYPDIREFYVPLKYSPVLVADVKGTWTICSPKTVSDFSAVGYLFAKELHKKLHVPIGIIFSAYGGTPAEDWVSVSALTQNPDLSDIVQHYDQQTVLENYKQRDKVMSGLYNGMIYPLVPFGIKGVAWYQGEANTLRAQQYQTLLPALIKNWRTDFGLGDFPFLIVQIAPYKDISPELREAQLVVTEKVKNTALIVTTDCGLANQIHPPDKQPIGFRLSLAARALAYKELLEYEGPIYNHYTINQNKMTLYFSHIGKGLMIQGDTLKGFTIAGADKIFLPAKAGIKKNKVVAYNPNITDPKYVRYGWANVPDVNLFNMERLPASPFRTDVQ